MKRLPPYFVLIFFAFLPLLSCIRNDFELYKGYYTVQADGFDEHGWKEYVSLYISHGRILSVEYNAINSSGFIKSWDMNYMRIMNAQNGTYPNAYTRIYAGRLLETQDPEKVDVISGASNSWRTFRRLTAAAIEQSRLGNPGISFVSVSEIGQ
ncbi:MAG: FMN-binding protein [Treponema sp.]|jgi:major membrane immunogen (membrane-anchored lipoprotein)|nr:FMN-binding protein [Treponema sp.]